MSKEQVTALSEKMADNILYQIIMDELVPGQFLPSERELQEQYKVSRTVVREAVKLLAARGIITTASRRGSIISEDLTNPVINAILLPCLRSNVIIKDILQVRMLIEPQIAAMASENATQTQIRKLYQTTERMHESMDQYAEDLEVGHRVRNEWDTKWHILLAQCTQNPMLGILIQIIRGLLWEKTEAIHATLIGAEQSIEGIRQHIAITDAVANQNSELASKLMIEHLKFTRENTESVSSLPLRLDASVTKWEFDTNEAQE